VARAYFSGRDRNQFLIMFLDEQMSSCPPEDLHHFHRAVWFHKLHTAWQGVIRGAEDHGSVLKDVEGEEVLFMISFRSMVMSSF
jgi:hypothetical protein